MSWQNPNLLQLGDHRLWVDKPGKLRLKKGRRPPTTTARRCKGRELSTFWG